MIKQYDVITMGSGLVDAFVNCDLKEKNNFITLPVGTKILVKDINFSVGGGGTNSAVCFSHIGLKTGFLGKVGKGYNSKIILRELEKNKIDFLGVQADEHSGYSIILETDKKNRTILTFKGASDNLKFSEIDLKKLNTKWFYFTSLGKESFESQKKIAEFARNNLIRLAYNPSSYHTKRGINYLSPILKNTFFLSLNKEEAGMLVKNGDLFKGLFKLGPKIVCITNGEKDGGVYDGKFLYKYWPNKIKVREATGAGDVFGSSFVAGLIKFNNIESALKMAITNVESRLGHGGTHRGLLHFKELEKIIKARKFKIKKEIL